MSTFHQHTSFLARFLRVAGVMTLAVGAVALSNQAVAGIANTKHNLGVNGTGSVHLTGSGTQDICVFCHTPHGADVSTVGAPLWNKNLNTPATTYTTYSSSTLDSTKATDGIAGGQGVGSTSIACLSCHDGTQAMDNIINAPGSGGYDSTGGGAGGRSGAAWTWTTVTARVNTDGSLASGNIANLGGGTGNVDLRNDHPIGVMYCGGPTTGTFTGSNCRDVDFKTANQIGTTGVFYVDTNANSTRDKSDMILFNRSFTGIASAPSVECGSCHDPHRESFNSTLQVAFMRVTTANSAICLSCHVK